MYEIVSMYYDMMYVNDESYRAEVEKVVALVKQYKLSDGDALLDIACGTGAQAAYLRDYFAVTGIDISDEMLAIAKDKVKDAVFVNANMCDYDLGRQFDVIVNLYGSIGHVESVAHLKMAMKCASRHLKPGGVFILTPWSTKESFNEALVGRAKTFELSGYCRMETVRLVAEDKIRIDYHHLISDNLDVTYHRHFNFITLFSESEYEDSIHEAGFKIVERLQPDKFRMGAFVCTI